MRPAILIVDDSLTVRADLEEAFAERAMPTIACATLAQARAALASEQIGVAILDVMLPDGDGVDLLREIRASARWSALPVLMLSTEAQVQHRIRGLQMGSNDYVGKPYERDYVLARVSELLGDQPPSATILVIDDSLTFREQLCAALRERGYQVASAASGEEGLRSIAASRPAAVVVDGVLPGIDGAGVVRKLRLDARLRHIPCILLTGSGDTCDELGALDSGADAFVRKDDDLDLILARVSALLRRSAAAPAGAAGLPGAVRILAVDDSMTYLQAQADVLRGDGYDVILAGSGEEALAMVKVQAIDCILLDRIMPGLGGTETCLRLKADPATRDIPLIMLTAMEDRAAMIEALGSGADDYVLKSSEFDVLKARVRAQLRRKQFEDESRRIRSELMEKELEAAEARAARALADSRAELLAILEQKNTDLGQAVLALQERQAEIDDKNRELERANQLKSEFLSNMSHELRTPLNAIIGFSELLHGGLMGAMSTEQRNCIGHIVSSGRHLLALINDILDLSKIEAGKMTFDAELFEPNTLLAACLDIVADSASAHRIALSFVPCADLGQASADTRKLKQMVYNLLSNAVKFSADGGAVTLSAHWCDASQIGQEAPAGMAVRILPHAITGSCLEVRVRDHGIGIEAHQLDHLFASFHQLDSSTRRQHEGTGLGLALVGRMAALHGGTAGIASAVQRGSQVSIWLPCSPLAPAGAAAGGAGAASPRRVLVIEHDPQAGAMLRLQFQSIGLQALLADSVGCARALAADCRPDLIALDLGAAGDGQQLLAGIRSDPALAATPVVAVSSSAGRFKACALGSALLLHKPVGQAALADAVDALAAGGIHPDGVRILVVGDDGDAAATVFAHLGTRDYRIHCAGGEAGALEITRQCQLDLLIVDTAQPGTDAFDTINGFRRAAETARLPILVLAAPQDGRAPARLQAGIDGAAAATGADQAKLREAVQLALQGKDQTTLSGA